MRSGISICSKCVLFATHFAEWTRTDRRLTMFHPAQAGASTAVGAGIAPAPLPAAKRGDETQVPPQQGSMQLPPSSQQVSPNAQKGSETLQMAPGPDQGMQEQQQQELIQVKLQLPGMAARAVALLRGPEETAVCLRQLFDTFADRIPSWRALSRKAGWGEHRDHSCVRACSINCSRLLVAGRQADSNC